MRQNNSWDLTQWYHVLNLEIEADIAPDGFGPFDVISAFGRVEVRYDCVWTRGCGIFGTADTYGDRSKRLPERLLRGRSSGYTLAHFDGDQRRYRQLTSPAQLSYNLRDIPTPSREPLKFGFIPGVAGLSASKGPDGELGTEDDPFPYYTYEFMDPDKCRFGIQKLWGSADLNSARVLPHTPDCEVIPNGPMANRPNPLSPIDNSPIIGGYGSGELPLRPVPRVPFGPKKGRGEVAQGLWLPNAGSAEMYRRDKFGSFDQNFSAGRAGLEPRRQPAGREGAEGGLLPTSSSSTAGSGCASASRTSSGARRSSSAPPISSTPRISPSPRCRAWRSHGSASGRCVRSGPSTTSGPSRTSASRWR